MTGDAVPDPSATAAMVWNSQLGYGDYTVKSSDFAGAYPTPGAATPAGWVWEMTYEFALDGAKYAGCTPQIAVTDMHNSPGKIGRAPSPPNLVASKTVDKATASPGDVVTWTITVSNPRNKDVKDADITDNISALLARGTLVGTNPTASVSGSTLTWANQDFRKGTSRTYTFQVQLAAAGWPTGTTTLPNTVVVTKSNCVAGSADPACKTTTTVTIPGTLIAQKTVDKAVANPGDTLNYTITVQNSSQGAVTNATVSDNISALLARGTFQSASLAAGEMQWLIEQTGETVSSVGAVRLRMSCGIYSGDCHFFLVGSTHRELVVTGPAART